LTPKNAARGEMVDKDKAKNNSARGEAIKKESGSIGKRGSTAHQRYLVKRPTYVVEARKEKGRVGEHAKKRRNHVKQEPPRPGVYREEWGRQREGETALKNRGEKQYIQRMGKKEKSTLETRGNMLRKNRR